MSEEIGARLLNAARQAAKRAYAPFSKFPVGAAVLDANGKLHHGCNVESASYGLSLCAERNAIFGAIAAGAPRPFRAIAVTCPAADESLGAPGRMPCGACRQVISEHLAPDGEIYVDGVGAFNREGLLPQAFALQ